MRDADSDATDSERRDDPASYRVLASAVNHPDQLHPHRGIFNERLLTALAGTHAELDVVSPRPFAPPVGPYSEFRRLPTVEERSAYAVHHPRFLYAVPKRYLYHLSGDSYAKRVPAYLESNLPRPDVVHAGHVYLDGYGVLPYCRAHDVPLFVVAHGTVLNRYDDHSPKVRSRVRETLTTAERVLCVSEALAERARQLVEPATVTTLPLGADPDKFPVEREGALRDELGVDRDVPVVLFCGHFSAAKGVRELMTAVERLDVDDAHVVCIGHGGDLRWELTDALRRSRYDFDVRWRLSPVAVRRWFALADLLVLPSHSEGRPMVIYEAMASETAVLASAVGGVPEQVADGETGVLVPPKDPAALTDALESLLADPERLDRLGGRGLDRLRDRGWTWDALAERLTALHAAAIRDRE
jgi:glycosyltransferase involved in cell wall biosynthesis